MNQNFFYPLYDECDRTFFADLQKAIKQKAQFIGDDREKIYFLKSLVCLQMCKNYRAPLRIIQTHLSKTTHLKIINDTLRSKHFKIDYSWAVWKRDKEMGKRAKTIFHSSLKLIGTNDEFDEFALRYLVSIWLVDWEGPLFALLQSTKNGKAHLRELNHLLSFWDFTNIFTHSHHHTKLA